MALRFIVAALILGIVVVAAGVVVGRMRAALPPAPPLDIRIDMPLDAQGRGSQRVANVDLAYAVEPFPARAGEPARLVLTARDLRPGSARIVTGTLETAPLEGAVDGRLTTFTPSGDALVADAAFPTVGEYRLRARLWGIFPDETYVTLIVVRVE
jgi:hypothetical protein